jgi:hypothetical protein
VSYIKDTVGSVACAFDPAQSFAGIDPTTNQPVGRDITHGEVYALLYSLYMDLAGKRDNPPAPVVEPEPVVEP